MSYNSSSTVGHVVSIIMTMCTEIHAASHTRERFLYTLTNPALFASSLC